MGVGDSDSGGRDGEVHGHFCSSDVLYLQKADLYLGLKTTWLYMCSFMRAGVDDGSSRDVPDCDLRVSGCALSRVFKIVKYMCRSRLTSIHNPSFLEYFPTSRTYRSQAPA